MYPAMHMAYLVAQPQLDSYSKQRIGNVRCCSKGNVQDRLVT